MLISTTVVCFNRLEYTKKTIESYLENTTVPHELVVVDNNSTDGTVDYIKDLAEKGLLRGVIYNGENRFPGTATNQGWELASPEADYLVRSDNDLYYHRGWDGEILQAFKDFPKAGQIGLVNELFQVPPTYQEQYISKRITMGQTTLYPPLGPAGTIGGPCMIPKKLYNDGLRWPPDVWEGAVNEDQKFSRLIQLMGFDIYEMASDLVEHIGFGDIQKYFDYYFETYGRRGLEKHFFHFLDQEKKGKIKNGKTVD